MILRHGRQKTENNNRRSWQFKRSIKTKQRLTIKAVSPFKDGSKDPFASLLFWRIDLYKFRVKASCCVWFVLWHTFLIQFPSCILWWECVWHVTDSQTKAAETALKRSRQMEKELWAASKRAAGIPWKRKFVVRVGEILVVITTAIIPAQLMTSDLPPPPVWLMMLWNATQRLPHRPEAANFLLRLVAEESIICSNVLSPTLPLSNLSLSG